MADTSFIKRVRGQLGMLSVLFLLGMAVNLLGEPETTVGKAFHGILLGLHVLVAIGLIVGGILVARAAMKAGGEIFRVARFAGPSVGIGFIGGVLTLVVKGGWSDVWSYVMAVGFLAAFIFYGQLYMKLRN